MKNNESVNVSVGTEFEKSINSSNKREVHLPIKDRLILNKLRMSEHFINNHEDNKGIVTVAINRGNYIKKVIVHSK